MNVFISNWMDEKKSLKIAKVLRDLGIKQEIKYFPDLYILLNIVQAAEFKPWPTFFNVPVSQ